MARRTPAGFPLVNSPAILYSLEFHSYNVSMSEDTVKLQDDSTAPEDFDAQAVARYWFVEAEEALTVADHLFERNDYSYALFSGHLAVEKELKGLHAIRQGRHAPPIHNLLRLAKAAGSSRVRHKSRHSSGSPDSVLRPDIRTSSGTSAASARPNTRPRRWRRSERCWHGSSRTGRRSER